MCCLSESELQSVIHGGSSSYSTLSLHLYFHPTSPDSPGLKIIIWFMRAFSRRLNAPSHKVYKSKSAAVTFSRGHLSFFKSLLSSSVSLTSSATTKVLPAMFLSFAILLRSSTIFFLLAISMTESQHLPTVEKCCTKKMVGNISYTLSADVFQGELPSQCRNDCVYTVTGTARPKFCFQRGLLDLQNQALGLF